MDAIIGRYKVSVETNELVLTHRLGISFDLTRDEALGLCDFINLYRQALMDAEPETEPRLERVVVEEHQKQDI